MFKITDRQGSLNGTEWTVRTHLNHIFSKCSLDYVNNIHIQNVYGHITFAPHYQNNTTEHRALTEHRK